MRILVLDDEPARHEVFMASWRGHHITRAWTAGDAQDALDGEPFDLVTLDHDLGPASRGNGMRVACHIVSMPEHRRPAQVLVHSANPPAAIAMLDTLQRAGIAAVRVDTMRLPKLPPPDVTPQAQP